MFENRRSLTRRNFLQSATVIAGAGTSVKIMQGRSEELQDEVEEVRSRFDKEELFSDLNSIQSDLLNFDSFQVNPIQGEVSAELYTSVDTEGISEENLPQILEGEYSGQMDQALEYTVEHVGTEEPLDSYRSVFLLEPGSIQHEVSTEQVEELPADSIYSQTAEGNLEVYLI